MKDALLPNLTVNYQIICWSNLTIATYNYFILLTFYEVPFSW